MVGSAVVYYFTLNSGLVPNISGAVAPTITKVVTNLKASMFSSVLTLLDLVLVLVSLVTL